MFSFMISLFILVLSIYYYYYYCYSLTSFSLYAICVFTSQSKRWLYTVSLLIGVYFCALADAGGGGIQVAENLSVYNAEASGAGGAMTEMQNCPVTTVSHSADGGRSSAALFANKSPSTNPAVVNNPPVAHGQPGAAAEAQVQQPSNDAGRLLSCCNC